MTHPLHASADDERFIYTFAEPFPSICRSTVRFIRRGATLARVAGKIYFDQGVRLIVRERIDYHASPP